MNRPRKPGITGGHISVDMKFVCPKCKTEWERNQHYKAIIHNQNMINIMSGNPVIISDMCGRCNHMVEGK